MKKKKYTEMSLEELTRQQSLIKAILIVFCCLWLLIICFAIYMYIARSKAQFALVPILVLPLTTMPALFISRAAINKEIQSRKDKV